MCSLRFAHRQLSWTMREGGISDVCPVYVMIEEEFSQLLYIQNVRNGLILQIICSNMIHPYMRSDVLISSESAVRVTVPMPERLFARAFMAVICETPRAISSIFCILYPPCMAFLPMRLMTRARDACCLALPISSQV